MKCPHCGTAFHDDWRLNGIVTQDKPGGPAHQVAIVRVTTCPSCSNRTYFARIGDGEDRMIFPIGANRGPVPAEVPSSIASDYIEACNTLPISAKASAALSRRCLQNILRAHGYKAKDLATEIDLLLGEKDASKAIPSTLRATIDGIRNFGNFSAHLVTDVTSLQVIDVEPEEAEWCLEILEEAFDHFYVAPAVAAKKKAALDAKLAAAGKPASKA